MGLDAALRIVPADFVKNCDDTLIDSCKDVVYSDFKEIKYWRKNGKLQQWMTNLYIAKGGTDLSFNGPYVRLRKADLNLLVNTLRNSNMPDGHGFFWGNNDFNQEDFSYFMELSKTHNFEKYALVYDGSY